MVAGDLKPKRRNAKSTSARRKQKNPDPKKLIKTQTWGEVPANQLAVLLKDGKNRKDAEALAKDLGASIAGEIPTILPRGRRLMVTPIP